ncbi:cell division protein DedD [Pectobacterium brasiliense]|uniref:Cell division protein DedD n=1 Tax=Pectobacterium brasiliense TaxID=180957 RepID=A0A0M2EY99_9GAMM|nr:cell division protein DedD [Pectobacterium brasiliense]KGA33194.1 cell division protein DedD [Pectobacterium brasiliense]
MASKFQNRLVGTVILVALGVIVLPGLLDGKKKHYEDEFASIPLIPKPGDSNEMEALPALNPSLPSQPPEGAEAAMQNSAEAEAAEARSSASSTAPETTTQTPPSSHSGTNTPAMTAPPVVVERPPVQTPAPVTPKPQPKPEVKPETQPTQQAPVGQAYIVQLGALKNADKVNEIVAKLRLSGYRAYTVPSTPVSGEITRIYVGPDASKQKLESSLGELKQLSGLSGQVRAHSVR